MVAIIGDIAFFLIRRLHRLVLRPLTFSFSVASSDLQLKFVCLTSFVLLLRQLRDLPHSKTDF